MLSPLDYEHHWKTQALQPPPTERHDHHTTRVRRTGSGSPVVVMASRFELKRMRDVPGFLLDSLRIRRQVLRADGALGVSLVAHPLRRQVLTLSAWSDRQAVNFQEIERLGPPALK